MYISLYNMNKYPLYHFICFGIAFISLFLPYRQYADLNPDTGLMGTAFQSGLNYEFPLCLIPLGLMFITSGILLIRNNLVTAILSMIMIFFLVIGLLFVYLILTLSFMGPDQLRAGIGFLLLVLVSIGYIFFLIRNLVLVVRYRREIAKMGADSDILDEF